MNWLQLVLQLVSFVPEIKTAIETAIHGTPGTPEHTAAVQTLTTSGPSTTAS